MKLRIFTDGACSENPGAGGWAALFTEKEKFKMIGGNEICTTNNRMELTAVVEGLKVAARQKKYDKIEVHSDSAYVVNAVNKKWIDKWKSNGWKTSQKEDVKNRDLWEQLDLLLSISDVEFIKVKGHAGNTFNEMCDKRAREEVLKAKDEELW